MSDASVCASHNQPESVSRRRALGVGHSRHFQTTAPLRSSKRARVANSFRPNESTCRHPFLRPASASRRDGDLSVQSVRANGFWRVTMWRSDYALPSHLGLTARSSSVGAPGDCAPVARFRKRASKTREQRHLEAPLLFLELSAQLLHGRPHDAAAQACDRAFGCIIYWPTSCPTATGQTPTEWRATIGQSTQRCCVQRQRPAQIRSSRSANCCLQLAPERSS